MSNLIKLEVDIDTLSPSKAAVLSQLFVGLSNCENFPVSTKEAQKPVVSEEQDPAPTEAPKTAPKRASRAKANTSTTSNAFADKERSESVVDEYETAKEIEVEAEEVKEETAPEPAIGETEESGITLDMLQSAMTPDIIDNHRKALKDKVAELGAAKLALLDKSKYAEMLDFLKGLK